jgi:hypothetical protein
MAPGTAYISLTEAGSSDATPFWLDLLSILLVPLRTPARIITNATLPQPSKGCAVLCFAAFFLRACALLCVRVS